MKEIWKNIKGYKNYQVSNLGRIRNLNYHRMGIIKLLNIEVMNNGYCRVTLSKNCCTKRFFLHRLVYEAFYGKIPFWMVINHKDEKPNNNRLENLMVCTYKENLNWGTRNKRISEKLTNGKSSKPILQYDLNGNFIQEWPSTMEIQRQLGYFNTVIGACCLNKYKQAYGYIWKYK